MANINAPFGFRQIAGLGSAPTYEQVAVAVNYNAAAIYYGDPVTAQADGSVAQSVSTGGSPTALGIAGVFQGCKYLSVAQKRTVWSNYWPGSDVASGNVVEGYIVNDPNAQFVAQTDATGAALGDVNATAGFAIGTGNAANGISGAYLVLASNTNVANNPFRIVSVINNPPGVQGTLSSGQPYDWVVVAFSNVVTRNATGV
jgi:hypothetical protein